MNLKQYKFDHAALISADISRSVKWYCKNLNAQVLYEDKSWALVECNGTKIAFVTKGDHSAHLAFSADSTEMFPCKPDEVGKHRDGSSYYYGSDPDGNIIEWIAYTDETE